MAKNSTKFGKKFLRPTILDEIHKIFKKYPYDGGILKEMIQNAEDAGAKNVSFIFDCRTFEQKSNYETDGQASLQQLHSIVSFNDACVTEEDWKGIQSIGISNKDKKAYKVGRFGLGMKSLFHLTDCIQIISGEDVVYLDPLCQHFDNEIHHYNLQEMLSKCPEKRRELEEATKLVADYDIKYDQNYPFTMFRLPLRNQPSEVCNQVLCDSDVYDLFDQFIKDGSNNLLFLKHLQSIKLYQLSDSGSELLSSIEIELSENIEEQRSIYREGLENSKSFQICYDPCFIIRNGEKMKIEKYLVVIQQNFDNCEIKTLSEKLHYQPCMGLAAPLDNSLLDKGSLFTFLPFSINVKFPIHIHGYFALNDSRSGLQFSKTMNDDDSQWNILILKNLLPNVYNQLFISLSKFKSVDEIVKFFPPKSLNDPFWSICSNEISSVLLDCEFVSGSLKKTQPKDTKFIVDGHYAKFKIEILKVSNINFVVLKRETLQILQTFFTDCFEHEVEIRNVILYLQEKKSWKTIISTETKLGILEYLLESNLDVSNMELIPIEHPECKISFRTFDSSCYCSDIYYPSNNLNVILNGMGIDFIARNSLTDKCKGLIEKMALKQMFQLTVMELSTFLSHVEKVTLKENFQNSDWLKIFINYILNENASIIAGKFDHLPLLRLTTNGKDYKSFPVKNLPAIFDKQVKKKDEKKILQTFGMILVRNVSKVSAPFLTIRESNNKHIIFNNVCEELFQNLFSSDFLNTGQHLSNLFDQMEYPTAMDLLNYLHLNVKSIERLSAKVQTHWKELKIFPLCSSSLSKFENDLCKIGLKSTLSEEILIKFFEYVIRNNDFALSRILQNYIIEKNITIQSELKWISNIESHLKVYPNGIDWFGKKKCLYDRHSVFSDNLSLLVGGVQPVIPNKLYHLLKCDSTLSKGIVKNQFWNIQSQIHRVSGKDMEKAERIIKMLYNQINLYEDWVSEFKNQQCAWTGKEFVHPSKIILNNRNIQIEPYRFYLPNNFIEFKEFYSKCGAKEDMDCINVLLEISVNPPSTCKNGISICSDILNSIQDANSHELKNIMIPVERTNSSTFSMKPLSMCTQAAASRFTGKDDDCYIIEFDENRFSYIIHNQLTLSQDTIKILDIRTINESLLEFEDWTQSENLCRRLKQLISEYKDGIGPIKELIQNADDARATTVKILLDERSSSVEDESKYFIGPSIWVYNDGLFSESDFDAIKSINSGHKELKKSTIGKFGIGFNSVYHYTETPSFISGNSYVRFDPHAQYSGSLSKQQRGGYRIKLNESKLKPLKRLLSPFEGIFNCKVPSESRFDGTLYKLQLRSDEQAFKSLISKNSYNSEDIKELINIVLELSSDLLIFTQCICEFQMFHINSSGDQKEIISVKKTLHDALDAKSLQIENIPKCLKEQEEYIKVIQHTSILFDPNESQTVVIIKIDKKVGSAFQYLNDGSEINQSYLWLIGQVKITNMLQELEKRGNIAIGGVAMSLTKNISRNNSLFCFLPLPISSHLPFHLNGSFAVSHDRRNIIRDSKGDKHLLEHEWNSLLFERVITSALIDTFFALRTIIGNDECYWYSLFPTLNSSTDQFIEKLIKNFYREMIKSSNHWFMYQMKWFESNNILFLSEELYKMEQFENIDIHSIAFDLFQLPFPKIPSNLRNTIEECEKDFFRKRIIDTETFYSNIVARSDSINCQHFDLIIRNGLKLFHSKINHILKQAKCIRTKPNGVLKLPGEVVFENSKLSSLFDFEENRFCEWNKEDIESLKNELSSIGMISSQLTVQQIIERCKVLEKHRKDKNFIDRGHLICSVIEEMTASGTNMLDEQLENLSNISFIPIKVKPENWILDWHDDGVTYLYSPKATRKCDFRLVAFVKPSVNNLRKSLSIIWKVFNIKEPTTEEVLDNVKILQNIIFLNK
ncbi:DgyrCDS14667 [Dimorphilus gyrociliatus]|uniref:DgyrCDS14667 n=1 Tax=Dimorphilus gyrociliatus TaxID=2664684 RepID=A0A7I8WED3_9ANNE|nr:DgyrCDS14667 [Dimorphilus gyrociliatus]